MTFFSLRAISLLATFKMVFSLPHAYSKVPVIKDGYAYVILSLQLAREKQQAALCLTTDVYIPMMY